MPLGSPAAVCEYTTSRCVALSLRVIVTVLVIVPVILDCCVILVHRRVCRQLLTVTHLLTGYWR